MVDRKLSASQSALTLSNQLEIARRSIAPVEYISIDTDSDDI